MADERVYIVDDDANLRGGLQFLFLTHKITSSAFSNGREFLDAIPRLEPGCILLDIRMANLDGMATLQLLQPHLDKFSVVMMTGHGDISTAVHAMKLGAFDFVEKPFDEELLVSTVIVANAKIQTRHDEAEERKDSIDKIGRLTPREREVLSNFLSGSTNREVADRMGVSHRTIEMHRLNISSRLQVKGLAEAVRIACNAGLRPPSDNR